MGLNTYPYSPFPASTEQLHKGDNEDLQAQIDSLKSGLTTLDNEVNSDATVYPYADVITIDNAVPANLADCSVKIEPVQDLHGYNKPWVGGAGKNQAYDVEYNDVTAQYGLVMMASYKLKQGKRYVISFDTPNSGVTVYRAEPSQLGFNSLSLYSFYCNGTRQSMYGVATADADFTGKYILFRYDETSATGTGELSNLQIEEVADDVTTPTDYAPYENICPITGHTEASVEVTDGDENTKTYTIALGDTIYGGTVNFDSGVMTVTMAQIASYDGETIGEPWISDRDVYAAGTTPTTGAQVVYTLATPTTIQLTPQQIQLLQGQNTLTASTGQISVTVNGVSGAIGSLQTQANDTNEALAELAADIAEQLPTAPTTDGAYVLTVTVADGTPTYSWESAT